MNEYVVAAEGTLPANPAYGTGGLMEQEAVTGDVLLRAEGEGEYTAMRLFFHYSRWGDARGEAALTPKPKIPRISLRLKNAWHASRWAFDDRTGVCSCVVTRRDDGGFGHAGTEIELCGIEAYHLNCLCVLSLELWRVGGKSALCTREFTLRKTSVAVKILFFAPKKSKVDMDHVPALKYEVRSSAGKPDITLKRFVGSNPKSEPTKIKLEANRSVYEERQSAAQLTGGADTLRYVLEASVPGTDGGMAEASATVAIMPPRINRIEAGERNGMPVVEYDTSYVSAIRVNGEPSGDIEHGFASGERRERFNLFCYGYDRYVLGTLHLPKIDDVVVDKLYHELSYEHKSGKWRTELTWRVFGADSILLWESKPSARVLPPMGSLVAEGQGDVARQSLQVKKNGVVTLIPLTSPRHSIESLISPDEKPPIARSLVNFIQLTRPVYLVMKKFMPEESLCRYKEGEWYWERWAVYRHTIARTIAYDDFFYGSGGMAYTREAQCIGCKQLKNCDGMLMLRAYQCAATMYLLYSKYAAYLPEDSPERKKLSTVMALEKTQYMELYRRLGKKEDILYQLNDTESPELRRLLCEAGLDGGFTGMRLLCFLADAYAKALGF